MQILSHRGYWKLPEEKNLKSSFERSFNLGFGTETDIRDLAGELVVSHDMPRNGVFTAKELFAIHQHHDSSLTLALNIKSDGLQVPLLKMIEEYQIENYFLFDMSIPDALVCLKHGLKCFTRQSEYEPEPAFYAEAVGVWLDGFHGQWWNRDLVEVHLDAGKKVCIVSPDLHLRPHDEFWEELSTWTSRSHPNLILCTDQPENARIVFDNT